MGLRYRRIHSTASKCQLERTQVRGVSRLEPVGPPCSCSIILYIIGVMSNNY